VTFECVPSQAADCDAGLLRIVLELDALHSLEAEPAAATGGSSKAVGGGAMAAGEAARAATGAPQGGDAVASKGEAGPGAAAAAAGGADEGAAPGAAAGGGAAARVPTVQCGAADVDALLSHWERTPAAWRDSVSLACRSVGSFLQAFCGRLVLGRATHALNAHQTRMHVSSDLRRRATGDVSWLMLNEI